MIDFLNRMSSKYCMTIFVFIVITVFYSLGTLAEHNEYIKGNKEISATEYTLVYYMERNLYVNTSNPNIVEDTNLKPLIKDAMKDNKITVKEYDDIKAQHEKDLENVTLENSKLILGNLK